VADDLRYPGPLPPYDHLYQLVQLWVLGFPALLSYSLLFRLDRGNPTTLDGPPSGQRLYHYSFKHGYWRKIPPFLPPCPHRVERYFPPPRTEGPVPPGLTPLVCFRRGGANWRTHSLLILLVLLLSLSPFSPTISDNMRRPPGLATRRCCVFMFCSRQQILILPAMGSSVILFFLAPTSHWLAFRLG